MKSAKCGQAAAKAALRSAIELRNPCGKNFGRSQQRKQVPMTALFAGRYQFPQRCPRKRQINRRNIAAYSYCLGLLGKRITPSTFFPSLFLCRISAIRSMQWPQIKLCGLVHRKSSASSLLLSQMEQSTNFFFLAVAVTGLFFQSVGGCFFAVPTVPIVIDFDARSIADSASSKRAFVQHPTELSLV